MRKWFFLVGVLYIIVLFYYDVQNNAALQKRLVTNLGLKLRGVITRKIMPKYINGYGVVYVQVIESNISQYDVRDKEPFYFCIIKDSEAIFFTYALEAVVGDTVLVNTNFGIVDNSRKELSFTSDLITQESFWQKIRVYGY